MATTDTTDVTLEILKRIQADQVAHRQETCALQQSLVDVLRLIQRLDTRISDIEADLETMFKMELIGQNAPSDPHGTDARESRRRNSRTS